MKNKWWLFLLLLIASIVVNVKVFQSKNKVKLENEQLAQTAIYLVSENKKVLNSDSTLKVQIASLIMDRETFINSTNRLFKLALDRVEANDVKIKNLENVFFAEYASLGKVSVMARDTMIENILKKIKEPAKYIDLSNKWHTTKGSLYPDNHFEGVQGYHCQLLIFGSKDPRRLKVWQYPMVWKWFSARKVKGWANSDDPDATFGNPVYIDFSKKLTN